MDMLAKKLLVGEAATFVKANGQIEQIDFADVRINKYIQTSVNIPSVFLIASENLNMILIGFEFSKNI